MKNPKAYKRNIVLLIYAIFITAFSCIVFSIRHTRKQRNFNVVLITIDALRSDHLGCYGYKRNTSPNIDKLASEGVLFTQAISQSTWTAPSVASLVTSAYPSEHMVYSWFQIPLQSNLTFIDILKQRSYSLGFITTNIALRKLLEGRLDIYEVNGDARDITKEAVSWIDKNKRDKFLLWVHYMDTHVPYKSPESYSEKYLHDILYDPNKKIPISTLSSSENEMCYAGFGRIPFILAQKGITEVDYYVAQYDGAISFVDEQVGFLLKKIEELGLDKKTIIVITSDHGEYMGEHNFYFFHKFIPYDSLIKVPLIFKCSGLGQKHKIIEQQVALMDISPTILDFLDIKAKIKAYGISLAEMILNGRHYPPRAIYSELLVDPPQGPIIACTSLRMDGWKIISDPYREKYELYNLKRDPQELTDLKETENIKFMSMKQKLDRHVKSAEFLESRKTKQPIDQQLIETLKSLGYMQ